MQSPSPKTMVCVTVQKTCERLIREGAIVSGGSDLCVLHVAKGGESFLGSENDAEALEYLYRISREFGAEMDVLRSDDVVEAVAVYAKQNNVGRVVLGASGKHGKSSLAGKLRTKLRKVEFVVV